MARLMGPPAAPHDPFQAGTMVVRLELIEINNVGRSMSGDPGGAGQNHADQLGLTPCAGCFHHVFDVTAHGLNGDSETRRHGLQIFALDQNAQHRGFPRREAEQAL